MAVRGALMLTFLGAYRQKLQVRCILVQVTQGRVLCQPGTAREGQHAGAIGMPVSQQ
jgi:hypothetical protein